MIRPGSREDAMHPMFVKLYLEPDADDPLAERERKRRSANRVRRTRSRLTVRPAAGRDRRMPR